MIGRNVKMDWQKFNHLESFPDPNCWAEVSNPSDKIEILKIIKNNIFTFNNWEMVRTTKITTSKTKKNSENSVDDQNIEKIY